MREILGHYLADDRQRGSLQESDVLRATAQRLVDALGREHPVELLARTDEALLVAAAAAMLRGAPTAVRRAPVGRSGWKPAEGAVLVEVSTVSDGLRQTLRSRYPGLRWLELPVVQGALAAAA